MASCYSTWRLTNKLTRVTPLPEEPGDSRMRTSTQLKLGGSGKRHQKKKAKKKKKKVFYTNFEKFCETFWKKYRQKFTLRNLCQAGPVCYWLCNKERKITKKKKPTIGHLFCHTLALWGYFVWLYASWDNCDWEVFNDTHLSVHLLEF